jgi:hypothetical protein
MADDLSWLPPPCTDASSYGPLGAEFLFYLEYPNPSGTSWRGQIAASSIPGLQGLQAPFGTLTRTRAVRSKNEKTTRE